jgi:hypothetical protein
MNADVVFEQMQSTAEMNFDIPDSWLFAGWVDNSLNLNT